MRRSSLAFIEGDFAFCTLVIQTSPNKADIAVGLTASATTLTTAPHSVPSFIFLGEGSPGMVSRSGSDAAEIGWFGGSTFKAHFFILRSMNVALDSFYSKIVICIQFFIVRKKWYSLELRVQKC